MAYYAIQPYYFFDSQYYIQQNPDVANWGGTALQHYINFGAREGRQPNPWFNAAFYKQAYADLAASSMSALQLFQHYNQFGFQEGRVPMLNFSNFNGALYLAQNPDVEAAGYTVNNAVSHFVAFGEYEGRVGYADNGVIITPVVNIGDTYTLTTGIDTFFGTQNNDTFNAALGGPNGDLNTLNSLDDLDGAGGVDTMNVTLAASVAPQILDNIEVFNVASINGTTAAPVVLNMANAAQAEVISNVGSTGVLSITQIIGTAAIEAIDIGNIDNAGADALFSFVATNTAAANLTVTDVVGATIQVDNTGATAATGAVNLTSEGTANVVTLTDNSDNIATVTIAGDASITLTAADATVVNGTNATGAITFTSGAAAATTIIGGSGADSLTGGVAGQTYSINGGAGNDTLTGNTAADVLVGGIGDDSIVGGGGVDSVDAGIGNDTINMSANFVGAGAANLRTTINGGLGTDTLIATAASLAAAEVTTTASTVSGVDILQTSDRLAAASTITTSNIDAGVTTVNLAGTSGNAGASGSVAFAAGASTVNLSATLGNGGAAADVFTVTAAGTAATDALTVANTAAATNVFNNNVITATGYEAVTINTSGTGAATGQVVNAVNVNASTAATATSLTLTGTNAVTVTGAASNSTGLFTIDASGLTAQTTGTNTLTISGTTSGTAGTQSVTGSSGDDVIALGAFAATVAGGNGNDLITAGAAAQVINAGDGNDTVNGSAGGNLNITLGAGTDVVQMGTALTFQDTIVGGLGTDTLEVTSSATGISAADASNVSGIDALAYTGNNALAQDLYNLVVGNTITAATVANSSSNATFTNAGSAFATLNLRAAGNSGITSFTRLVDTAADALTVTLGGTQARINANGEETLTLTNSAATIVTRLDAAALTSLNVGGVADLTITQLNGNATGTTTVTDSLVAQTGAANTDLSITTTGNANYIYTQTGTAEGDLVFNKSAGTGSLTLAVGSYTASTVTGGSAADSITGGAGTDLLTGGAGNDTLIGNGGIDILTGGTGTDAIYAGTDAVADIVVQGIGASEQISGIALTGVNLIDYNFLLADTVYNMDGADLDVLDIVDYDGSTAFNFTNTAVASNVFSVGDDEGIYITGNYNASTGAFLYSATGADTIVIYDSSEGAAITIEATVLVGFAGTLDGATADGLLIAG